MPAVRAILAAFLVLAFSAGYGARYFSHHDPVCLEKIDDPRYCLTPHIQQYYDALQVEHVPKPPNYRRGMAGLNWCRNVAQWFAGVQFFVNRGFEREQIREVFEPQLDYEIAHGWMDATEKKRIMKYTEIAPTIRKDLDALGRQVYGLCIRSRGEVEV